MSTAVPAKAETLVKTTLSELATPTAENLSLQARSALQAKLAEYPQSNKPTGQASEAGSGVKSQTQSPAKCVVISPLVPGAVPPSSTLTPADLISPSSAPVAAALGDTGKPKLNGTEGGVKSDRRKAQESSESSTTSSESSSSSESDGEKKKKVAEVINTPPPAKRKRGRPPKSAQAGSTVQSTGRIPKTPKSTPRRRPPPPLVSVTPDVKTSRQRGRGCGNCPGCLRDDCGKCPYCLDKPKFGGPGVKKQRCSLRVCSNFVAAPGVRNPKHSLTLSAATSAAANAKAVEKKPLMTSKTVPVKELDKEKSTPVIVPSKELKDTPKATSTTTAVVVTVPAASPNKNKKGELKMRCIQCSRERKQSMARSEKFCTQRCILQWLEDNPEKSLEDALTEAIKTGDDDTPPPATSSEEVQKKPSFSRVLKNLQIDMALPGTTLTAAEGEISPPPTTNPLSPPTLAPSPKPVPSTTIIRTRKQAGEALKTMQAAATTGKKTTETPPAAGSKRATQQQPASVKKPKQDFMSVASLPPSLTTMAGSTAATKSVSFDLATTTIPVSTVQPISAPPLSRTIQPPSISIVPLDQLTALGTALLNQQKQQKQQKPEIPTGLPVDIRKWSIDQVVAYFQGTSDCKDYADIFREQEVDGTALLLLSHESLVKCLGIKLGRALKIMLHVEELRKQHEVLQYNV